MTKDVINNKLTNVFQSKGDLNKINRMEESKQGNGGQDISEKWSIKWKLCPADDFDYAKFFFKKRLKSTKISRKNVFSSIKYGTVAMVTF